MKIIVLQVSSLVFFLQLGRKRHIFILDLGVQSLR